MIPHAYFAASLTKTLHLCRRLYRSHKGVGGYVWRCGLQGYAIAIFNPSNLISVIFFLAQNLLEVGNWPLAWKLTSDSVGGIFWMQIMDVICGLNLCS